MRIERLPWEAVSGLIVHAQDPKPRKKWVQVGGWILSVILMISGVVSKFWIFTIFGILYLLALVMKKEVVVTKRGVETFYQMYITTQYEIWNWSELGYVLYEDRKKPGLTALLFNRGDRVKRLYFKNEDAVKIVEMVKADHPNILTGEADDYSNTDIKSKSRQKS